MRIIVLFNLRPGVDVAADEDWAIKTDIPIVNGLGSIKSFTVHKAESVLGSDAASPYQYFEVVDVADEEQFGTDGGGISDERNRTAGRGLRDRGAGDRGRCRRLGTDRGAGGARRRGRGAAA